MRAVRVVTLLFFTMSFLFHDRALATDVIMATSEDINEFDQLLEEVPPTNIESAKKRHNPPKLPRDRFESLGETAAPGTIRENHNLPTLREGERRHGRRRSMEPGAMAPRERGDQPPQHRR